MANGEEKKNNSVHVYFGRIEAIPLEWNFLFFFLNGKNKFQRTKYGFVVANSKRNCVISLSTVENRDIFCCFVHESFK